MFFYLFIIIMKLMMSFDAEYVVMFAVSLRCCEEAEDDDDEE